MTDNRSSRDVAHETTAEEIMNARVPAVAPLTPVSDVIQLMVEHDSAGIAVVDGDEIVGIITESDVISREAEVDAPTPVPFFDALFNVDAGRQYDEEVRRVLATSAAQLMSSPVISIRRDATLHEIASVMINRDKHPMPVVDERGRYLGIVSRRDLVRVIATLEGAGS